MLARNGLEVLAGSSGGFLMAKVQINYKSGQSVVVKCKQFTVRGHGTTFEWEDMEPRPLLLGANDIESVWEL